MEGCGEDGQVKLLGMAYSPFVVRVCIALALKGIHYEFIEEDVLNNKSELLLQSNPVHKKIPVLIHNGKPVCESMIIVQYIEEAWDSKAPFLMPRDPYDRAIARFWAAFIDDKVIPSIVGAFRGQGEEQQKAGEESVENLLLLEEVLRSTGKASFGGDGIGLVDIALGGLLVLIQTVEKVTNIVLIDTQKTPLLSAWADQFCKADKVKKALPDRAELFVLMSAWRAKLTSPPTGN
uniref:glutathione transferase n=1 Tax=Pinus yunnanensis TaxID=88732 RepID=A0A9E8S0N2_PINYU|nr:tau class glutathione S-transferases [Pinus yunnanensis]